MKGIILAGGSGSRLRPLTKVTSKQLLPIYNKPMIYYPLQTLLTAGIEDIMIIVAPDHAGDFLKLLGSGKEFGCDFTYEIQDEPEGLAQAFLIGEDFIGDDDVTLILGDNLFEDDFSQPIQSFESGGRVFAKKVEDPERFGVVEFDQDQQAISIEEKPNQPKSEYAITGLYIYDHTVVDKAKSLEPSDRGELEITDINNLYLKENNLDVAFVNGQWFDTGTFESMYQAVEFARQKELS
jgi:glucose-1-phosphate thymidylyltransferase